MTILVTGSTGKTSGPLAALLYSLSPQPHFLVATRKAPSSGHVSLPALTHPRSIPASSAPAVNFDWLDDATWSAPFKAAPAIDPITAIWMVAPPTSTDPVPGMTAFTEFAIARGVKRFVLLSATPWKEGGHFIGGFQQYLRQRGAEGALEWASLRPTWFMQNFSEQAFYVDPLKRSSKVSTATGEGKLPWVDTGDIANVAMWALTTPEAPNRELIVVGPELLTYGDCAEILSKALGRRVVHEHLSREERRDAWADKAGLPGAYAEIMADMDVMIKEGGEEGWGKGVLEEVTGVRPRRFADYVRENRDVWMP